MAVITIDQSELKNLVKSNLIEILKERDDLFSIMEDIVFGKMMDDSKSGVYVDKSKILDILDNIK